MNPWIVYPAWQNFSSMYRESVAASGSRTGMERAHHSTAAVYFGIAALEAFLNEKMREHLKPTMSYDQVYEVLRKGNIKEKLRSWPEKIVGSPVTVGDSAMKLLTSFIDVRNDLTHPKTHGHDVYAELEAIEPAVIVSTVAEYIVRYHEAVGTPFPYWVFGWNFLNPRSDSYDIILINEQQFTHSMLSLRVTNVQPTDVAWRQLLGSFAAYTELREKLQSLDRCEPKKLRFPHAPVLCRLWWTYEHQQRCGCVTEDAVRRAIEIDNMYGNPVEAEQPKVARLLDRIREFRRLW